MNLLRLAFIALLLVLLACSDRDLPPEYRRLEVPMGRLDSTVSRQRGRDLFLVNCALCHGERADGRGLRRNLSSPAASFANPLWVETISPRRAFFVIREGRRGTPMPAFKVLTEEEIWDLVAYVMGVATEGT